MLISDYGKGACTEELIAETIKLCRDTGMPVLIDPARGANWEQYRNATLVKPNRLEAELAIGRPIRSPADAIQAAVELRDRYDFETVVITLDRDGLVFASSEVTEHQPITPCEVCDITGAGDTVLATLGIGIAAHKGRIPYQPALPISSIASIANVAAGLQVTQAGVAPISRIQLQQAIETHSKTSHQGNDPIRKEVVSLETATQLAAAYRAEGKSVAFTNGCFDLLHVGHIQTLEAAAELADVLFVAINSDDSVCHIKGPGRPIISERDRAQMLCSLTCVDHVLIFDDRTPHQMLEMIRPDVLVKGGSTSDIIGREVVERYGGRIAQTQLVPGCSTTALCSQIHGTTALEVGR